VLRDRDADSNGSLEERLYAVQDANWNVTGVATAAGTVAERFVYEPYGDVSVRDGAWATKSGSAYGWQDLFQGRRWDGNGNTYDFRWRNYSTTLGRWLQVDPINSDYYSRNTHLSFYDSPIMFFDPSGLIPIGSDTSPSDPVENKKNATIDIGGHEIPVLFVYKHTYKSTVFTWSVEEEGGKCHVKYQYKVVEGSKITIDALVKLVKATAYLDPANLAAKIAEIFKDHNPAGTPEEKIAPIEENKSLEDHFDRVFPCPCDKLSCKDLGTALGLNPDDGNNYNKQADDMHDKILGILNAKKKILRTKMF
jgi:RHS repeat-associated protein